jgi:hypothetical protein
MTDAATPLDVSLFASESSVPVLKTSAPGLPLSVETEFVLHDCEVVAEQTTAALVTVIVAVGYADVTALWKVDWILFETMVLVRPELVTATTTVAVVVASSRREYGAAYSAELDES